MMRYCICVLLTCICTLSLAEKKTQKNTSENLQLISQMSSLTTKERSLFLERLSKERSDMQGNLIHQLGNSSSKEIKFAAAFLLGIYRMGSSVYSLSRNITLENENYLQDYRISLWERYPVVEALIRIGKPAVPEMLRNIRTSDDKKVIELSIRVIRYVEGPDIGLIILKKELAKQTDSQTKTKFKEAITSFEELVEKTSATPGIKKSGSTTR